MTARGEAATPAGRSVVVIGGGFGGLASACYLTDAGFDVTVVEKNDQLGGPAGSKSTGSNSTWGRRGT